MAAIRGGSNKESLFVEGWQVTLVHLAQNRGNPLEQQKPAKWSFCGLS